MLPKSTKNFVVKFTPTNRTTIIISKNVAKRAVDRNRIRRIVKEALKKIGYKKTIILIAKNNIASLKSQEVHDELKSLNL